MIELNILARSKFRQTSIIHWNKPIRYFVKVGDPLLIIGYGIKNELDELLLKYKLEIKEDIAETLGIFYTEDEQLYAAINLNTKEFLPIISDIETLVEIL